MLLQRLPDDVERKIVAVDDTLDKVEIVGHHVLEVIGDEDPPDVELDLVLAGLLGINRRDLKVT